MTEAIQAELRNNILRSLPPASYARLAPALEPVILTRRMKLCERERPTEWIVFPDTGIASVVARNGPVMQEMGIFGREGASAASMVLGARHAMNMVVVQIPGTGHRIPTPTIAAAFQDDKDIRDAFIVYMLMAVAQITETAFANTRLNITQRLARWLLMIHDRVDGDEIRLTHDYLSLMLGVARPGVTMALQSLEREGVITTARGRLTIADRTALVGLTAGIYSGPPSIPHLLGRAPAAQGRPPHHGATGSAVR